MVDRFELVFGDGEVEADFSGEVEAVCWDLGVVEGDGVVGVVIEGGGVEGGERGWAVE